MQNFRNLEIWKRSYLFTLKIYKVTALFPVSENYNLTSQIRRAAVSIPSNISEGCAKLSRKDFLRFLEISLGSICELQTQIEICKDLNYIKENTFSELSKELLEIKKMTSSYIFKTRNNL
ncbi:MAG: four helix bundle protein [Candidatus Dojkabacteria bacterium]